MAQEIGFDFDGAILCEFESNGCPSVSFLKFFLNGKEEVVGFFFVDIEFAIPSDSGGPGTVDFHAWENFCDEVADQFGEKDELSWVRAFPRKGNQAGNSARDLNEGVSGRFLVAGFRIKNDEVDRFIEKLGDGVAGVDSKRGENGEDITLEEFAGPSGLGLVELLNGTEVNALLGKGGNKSFVEKLVLVGNHSENAGADSGEDLGGAETIRTVNIAAVVDELFEGGDADFKELVQIRANDGKEFQPFEQGLGRVLSLFENALIKLKPTEFTIQVRR